MNSSPPTKSGGYGNRYPSLRPQSPIMAGKTQFIPLHQTSASDSNSLGRSPMRPSYPPNYVSKAHLLKSMDRGQFIKLMLLEEEREKMRLSIKNGTSQKMVAENPEMMMATPTTTSTLMTSTSTTSASSSSSSTVQTSTQRSTEGGGVSPTTTQNPLLKMTTTFNEDEDSATEIVTNFASRTLMTTTTTVSSLMEQQPQMMTTTMSSVDVGMMV